MLFNILTANHGGALGVANAAPLIDYARHTLSRCGHEVIIDNQRLYAGAVNLFFEYFADRETAERLLEFKRQHKVIVGVIATELIVDGKIPYGQHVYTGPDDPAAVVRARVDNFTRMAPSLDFIWCFLERTAREYLGKCPIVELFPVGHVHSLPDDLKRSPKDLDVVFFGTATPHRRRVIDRLAGEGISVVTVGRSFEHGWASPSELASLLDRAKIGLNLTLNAYDGGDVVDPRFPSCHRLPEMLGRGTCVVSETIPLDNYYEKYIISAEPKDLARRCGDLLASGEWRSWAASATQRFRDEMDVTRICKPVIDRTLQALITTHSSGQSSN
jgi:hypothetical protein